MLLDPRQFAKQLVNVGGGRKKVKYQGNGVLLNLEDVRTFGGIIRFYTDSKQNLASTGAQSQPIRVRNPVKLPEMSSFKIALHLQLKSKLPAGVVAFITPTPELAKSGLIFCHEWIKDSGALWVSAIALRKIEIETNYPVALLVFMKEQDASVSGIETVSDSEPELEVEEDVTYAQSDDSEDIDDSFLDEEDDFDDSLLLDEENNADNQSD